MLVSVLLRPPSLCMRACMCACMCVLAVISSSGPSEHLAKLSSSTNAQELWLSLHRSESTSGSYLCSTTLLFMWVFLVFLFLKIPLCAGNLQTSTNILPLQACLPDCLPLVHFRPFPTLCHYNYFLIHPLFPKYSQLPVN